MIPKNYRLLILLSVITALWLNFLNVNVYTSLLLLCMFEDSHNLKRTFSERIQEDKLKSTSSDNTLKEFCCKKRAKKYWRLETDGKVGQKKQDFFF